MRHWTELLPENACVEALAWARTTPDPTTAWKECKRGDWMLWLLSRFVGKRGSAKHRKLVLCCCNIVVSARPLTKGEALKELDKCLRTVRSWARGRGATLHDILDLDNYFDAYVGSTAVYANNAFECAVAVASSYEYDAAEKAGDTSIADSLTADAARYDAYERALARCANIVRRYYPHPPTLGKEVRVKPPKRREISAFYPSRSD